MNDRQPKSTEATTPTRRERKEQTRRALLDGAFERLEHQGFGSLSLREVTRAAGITPTAFYRHFEELDDLGDALVDDSFRAVRAMVREMRGAPTDGAAVERRLAVLDRHLDEQRARFRFIARERSGGTRELRSAIRAELDALTAELAVDLARTPQLGELDVEVLSTVAGLLVSSMAAILEVLVDLPAGAAAAREEQLERGRRQLRLVLLGAVAWGGRDDA